MVYEIFYHFVIKSILFKVDIIFVIFLEFLLFLVQIEILTLQYNQGIKWH